MNLCIYVYTTSHCVMPLIWAAGQILMCTHIQSNKFCTRSISIFCYSVFVSFLYRTFSMAIPISTNLLVIRNLLNISLLCLCVWNKLWFKVESWFFFYILDGATIENKQTILSKLMNMSDSVVNLLEIVLQWILLHLSQGKTVY